MGFDPADVTATAGLAPLTPAEAAAFLRAARDHVVSELTAMGDAIGQWRPTPDEWSANECVGHMIEADRRGFGGRIRRILAENGVAEQGWNQVEVAAQRRDRERPVAAIIDEFRSVRDDGIALVTSLEAHELDRHAVHAVVGRVSVSDLLHEWVFHDRNHIRQLLANTQARAWPAMGNARRFSHPDR
jgi:DinB superfamily